jgi:hypothetical protein
LLDAYIISKCAGSLKKLALSWAPINYQYISLEYNDCQTKKDLLCPVNFECYSAERLERSSELSICWNTRIVRRRLRDADLIWLTASAYYSIAITESHYFILYSYYHADDDTHPSDLEGCLIILEKDEERPRLLGAITVAHQDFVPYVYADRMKVKSRPVWQKYFDMLVEEELDGDHALIQQAQGKHGLYALTPHIGFLEKFLRWIRSVKGKPEDVIVYFPGETANEYTKERLYRGKGTPHNPTFYYELIDILDPVHGLYDRYIDAMNNNGNDTFTKNGAFHNDESIGNANGPWLWKPGRVVGGTVKSRMWDSPAELASEVFKTAGKDFSTIYLKKMDEK